MTEREVTELFAGPVDPETEARMLSIELAALHRRHARACKPIVERLAHLARESGNTVIPFPGSGS